MPAEIIQENVATVEFERTEGKKILRIQVTPELEETFQKACKGDKVAFRNGLFAGARYPVVEGSPQFKKWAGRYILNRPEYPLDHDQTYNFSFLFMEGSSKGLELEFGGLYSEEFMVDYAQHFEHFIQEIYNEFVSPVSIVAELKLHTVRV